MKTTNPSLFILGASPVNKDAAKELSANPEPYKANILLGAQLVWDTCPPFNPLPVTGYREKPYKNFLHAVKGRLTVVGFGHKIPTQKGPASYKWICRCSCGKYTTRSGLSLNLDKQTDIPDCCPYCRHLEILKTKSTARQLGHYEDGEPINWYSKKVAQNET